MPLFSRRVLQRLLNENAVFVSEKQNSNACGLLNVPHEHYVATEWEQVIVNAASKCGTVQYEAQVGDSTPDLLFRTVDGSLEFIADITAPSDQGFHDLNPMDAFEYEFWRLLAKFKSTTGGFDLRVDSHSQTAFKGAPERLRLKLPERSKWKTEIFNANFYLFLRGVTEQPEQRREFNVVSVDVGVHFVYDPTRKGSYGTSHPAFTLAMSKTKNPAYIALNKKGDQIKRSRYQGMAGIFLCDGGCQMISAFSDSNSFSIDEIIRYFFRQYDSVWFVMVLGIKEYNKRLLIQPKLHLNPKKPGTDFVALKAVMEKIYRSLPALQCSAQDARYRVKAKNLTGKYYGVLTHGGYVKMSAREMLEILAGVKTIAKFEQNYSLTPQSNPFKKMLQDGRPISRVTVEQLPDNDDDVVTIEFGIPDAAVAPFQPVSK